MKEEMYIREAGDCEGKILNLDKDKKLSFMNLFTIVSLCKETVSFQSETVSCSPMLRTI